MQLLKSSLTLVSLFFVMGFTVHAQNKGFVTGVVKDAITHSPIAYASVEVTGKGTSGTIRETQTLPGGSFSLNNLPGGTFTLQISFVGYETLVIDSLSVAAANDTVSLGTLNMYPSKSNVLSQVTVTSNKGLLQNVAGKKVFQVNQSLVSDGGTAADLLQNVPTLQIEADGNISLRGSTGVQVLVDGKPSLIAGGTVAQVLQSIPASQIDRVEIITNPSAKYDASGQSIVNIVLKQNTKRGFNGSAAVTAGTRNNYNASTSLSYQTNKINLYGNYSFSRTDAYSTGIQYITYLNTGNPAAFSDEVFPSITVKLLNNAKAGIDYTFSNKSILGFSASVNTTHKQRHEYLTINQLGTNLKTVQFCNCNNGIYANGTSYNLNLDYSQHFTKPGEELTFNVGYAHGINNGYQHYSQDMFNINGQLVDTSLSALQTNDQGHDNNYNIQADYTLPVGKTGKVEAGYRTQAAYGDITQQGYESDNGGYTPYNALFNAFSSTNVVHALYVSYQGQYKDFTYQLGLRGEDALLKGNLINYDTGNALVLTPIKVANTGIYPSIFLTQKLQGNQQLQLSFARRVTRSTPYELNPYLDVSDPVNYITGNQALLPEIIHSAELGYRKSWPKTSLAANAYFIGRTNVIKHIQTPPVNGVVFTIPENLPRSVTSGLELIANTALLKVWDFTANANIFMRTNAAAPQYGITQSSGLSWNANITNNINLVKNLSIQIRADYRAADVVIQDRNRPAFGLDAAAKYDFPNKKATLTLSSRDIFNSRKWAFLRVSQTNLLDFVRRTQTSRVSLTFAYHFGTSPAASKKPAKTDEQREKRIDEAS